MGVSNASRVAQGLHGGRGGDGIVDVELGGLGEGRLAERVDMGGSSGRFLALFVRWFILNDGD